MSKKETIKVNKDIELTQEQNEKLYEEGEKIAQELGYDSGDEFASAVTSNLRSTEHSDVRKATRQAGSFASKLSMLLFEQILYNSLGTSDVYRWVNKFSGPHLKWGNAIQFSSTFATNATTYDRTKFIPDATTDPVIETFTANFKKADGTLATNAYQYKKSLSLDPKNWLPYFNTGKLATVIANITKEMMETYRLFVANKLQQIVKTLASGTAQVTTENAGENGSALRLVKKTSNATDSYGAIIDLMSEINDLINDVNNTTISSNSPNIRAVDLDDLVFFIPKKVLATFKSGVLSRLPSASLFDYETIFTADRVIPIGAELNTIQDNTNNVVSIKSGATPFITGNDKIIVMEKSAIQHCYVIQESESQYFAENMIQQLTNHIWGFFVILPFKKGFVFECQNLLTLPN